MSRPLRRAILVALLAACALVPAQAQFGKNKITYENFDWKIYKSPHFDIHYYPSIEIFLEDVVSYAESAYLKISKDLDHELRFRVPLIIYKTHGEFQQTNVTLAELPEGVGAFAEPVQYRMVLPIDGPPDKLYQLIAHELVHIFEYSMFYEGYLGRAIRGQAPTWLMEGLASYLAEDEDNLDRMAIRDAVVNNILPPIQALNQVTFLTYRYGHAIFDFIEQEHGKEGLRSFLFEFKKVLLTGNLGRAIKESFGYDIDEFNRRFNRYLRRKYFPVLLEKKSPDDYGHPIVPRQGGQTTFSPSLSPSGQLIATLAVPGQELDLVVISAEDGDTVKNLTKGFTNSYRNLVTQVFAGKRDLSWSPVADEVVVFARRENRWPLLIFHAITGKKLQTIDVGEIYECASPTFSPDGRRIAFEGNKDGIVDIFEYDLDSGEIRNLTQDDFFDANPWYAKDGKSLLYNRRIGSHWKIFSVDSQDPSKKTQLTFGAHSDLQPSYSRDEQEIFFASDKGPYGVFNIFSLDLQSGDMNQYTDVVGGAFGPVELAERGGERSLAYTAYFEGAFRLYRMPLRSPELKIDAESRLSDVAEAEPFEPPLRLTTDEEDKLPYKIKWDLETPGFSVGVTDDGTFLANAALQFTDLLGNHRIGVSAATVSDFASYQGIYMNLKRRYNWGAQLYDFRDYLVDRSTGQRIQREYRQTGGNVFISYPLSRYYRMQAEVGALDLSSNQIAGYDATDLSPIWVNTSNTFGIVRGSIVGDTVRYKSFGPYQGKRFNLSAQWGPQIDGDIDGDWNRISFDFRAYRRATRRSLIAFRFSTLQNLGDQQIAYGFGGLNQLRGWEFREFYGTDLAWMNFEFRFPLVDEMRFPILALSQIRGFFFADVGAAAYDNDFFYDPELRNYRFDQFGEPIKFKFWDSAENRLQDGRASYGVGFQFFFLGGLQFNWIWANRLSYTQYCQDGIADPCVNGLNLLPVKARDPGTVSQFYIAFDY
jgi:hypothetical protein